MKNIKFAIISDIHGNLPALLAVLSDCEKQNIDRYIFLGDYYGEFPQMNEAISLIKSLNRQITVRGNKEARMIEAVAKNHNVSFEQLAPLRWNIANISYDNFDFIKTLPDKDSFTYKENSVFAAHSPTQHFGATAIDKISGRSFTEQFGKDFFNHNEYLRFAENIIISDEATCKALSKSPNGIYMFGHYHTQWNVSVNGKYLINPGACGLPLDNDCSAPYTILDIGNEIHILEKRVHYDIKLTANALINSDFFDIAPFWNKLAIAELENAKIAVLPFLEFAEKLAVKNNDYQRPFSNELWHKAIKLYRENIK